MYDYEPNNERYSSTYDLPNKPIDPKLLSKKVSAILGSSQNIIPYNANNLIEELCKGFNHCVALNKPSSVVTKLTYLAPKTLIFSPKTGSAKSLSAKAYASLLPSNHKSLIVVLRVDDALDFCADINTFSSNPNKARCSYSITSQNSNNSLRVDLSQIDQFDCIVITHAMYKLLSLNFSNASLTRRDFIVIDERISMTKNYEVVESSLVALINTLEGVNTYTTKPITLDQTIDTLQELQTVLGKLCSEANQNSVDTLFITHEPAPILFNQLKNQPRGKHFVVSREDYTSSFIGIKQSGTRKKKSCIKLPSNNEYDFPTMLSILQHQQKYLAPYAAPLISNQQVLVSKILKVIEELSDTILKLEDNNMMYHRNGSVGKLIMHEKIPRSFGTHVVLDATSEINKFYEDKVFHDSSYVHYKTTDPRTYSNLTINIAMGYNQGKSSIYEGLNTTQCTKKANCYLQLAQTLISPQDKLLIVSFKNFVDYLKQANTSPNIEFTHWGNHVGKNNWSHCNKVMIIGWNYLPRIVHRSTLCDASNTLYSAVDNFGTDTNNEYSESRLADDLVQASMRGSARKIVDKQGNCNKSEVYLFSPATTAGQKVIEYYISQFKDAVINHHWQSNFPKQSSSLQQVSSKKTNEDKVIDYLKKQNLQSGQKLDFKTCRTALSISETSFSKLPTKYKLSSYLKSTNMTIKKEGRSKYFVK